MRVLVAPDKFAGTLTATQAAAAIAEGWRRQAPGDTLVCLPMSDGGPGFRQAMSEVAALDVSTAYVESAEFCGPQAVADVWTATSAGVGDAIRGAVAAGASTVVVGLGGSGTNDGGAGLLAALGATADVDLVRGPDGLRGIRQLDLTEARRTVAGVRLIAAADTDVPLLGLFGATKTFGPQKGLADDDLLTVDGILDDLVVAATGPTPAERRIAETPGAGAAGGIGFALLLLGAELVRGVDVVADAVGLAEACRDAELVISGEGAYDHTSRTGKVVYGVAQAAAAAARPCVVLAGQVTVGTREARAMGVDGVYSAADLVGLDVALAEPAASLARLAERAARTWSRPS